MKILVADIGGTHANFSAINRESYEQLTTHTYPTQEYETFDELLQEALGNMKDVKEASFAVAGPVSDNRVEMTNADLVVDARRIQAGTRLESVIVLNDFEAVSYAVNIENQPMKTVQEGNRDQTGTRAIIGAGTGLGKGILYYDFDCESYTPLPSEGGHVDFAPTPKEHHLIDSIRTGLGRTQIRYEDLVSGTGIEHIYNALEDTYPGPNDLNAEQISEQRHENERAKKTMHLFIRFYARAARNFALNTYCTGGLYIAGGIASKNLDMFHTFTDEFTTHPTHSTVLKQIPIIILTDYSISLKGAAYALKERKKRCIGDI